MNETQGWLDRAAAVMTPSYKPAEFVASHGKGAELWDVTGRRFIDLGSGIGVGALGHGHAKVLEAIKSQAEAFCHTANVIFHRPSIEICERLTRLSFAERVFLSNSGTEAMEAALKVSRRYFAERATPERTRFVSTEGSFHGRSFGALSITGQPKYHEGYGPLLPGVDFVPFNDLDAAAAAIGDETAAFVVEPVQGNSGVVPASKEYLRGLRKLCDERGCLLIFDEIQTGIGRTGRWFAHQHADIAPDIMTIAKPLGGGLPLGAMVATGEVGDTLALGSHGSTFAGNPVACAAGLASLDVVEEERLVQRSAELGARLVEDLMSALAGVGHVKEVRGLGLMIGIESERPASDLRQACLDENVLVTGAGKNVVRLLPPLNIEQDVLHEGIEGIVRAFAH